MGTVLPPGYPQWRAYMGEGAALRTTQDYAAWLRSNGMSATEFINLNQRGIQPSDLTNPLTGQPYPSPPVSGIRVPGQPQTSTPAPSTPGLTQIPTAPTGPPAYAPPPVSMPAPLPNPTPQGLGGMPMIRDRMMGATMAPFAQPNWGVPQVPQQYLTSQQPLPGGSVAGIDMVGQPARQGLSDRSWLREISANNGFLGGGVPQPQVGMANPQAGIGPAVRPANPQEMVGLGQIPGLRIPRKVPQGMGTR